MGIGIRTMAKKGVAPLPFRMALPLGTTETLGRTLQVPMDTVASRSTPVMWAEKAVLCRVAR